MSLERSMSKMKARGGGAPESPSRDGGAISPSAVTSGILAEEIYRLWCSGKEYRATFNQFTDKLVELGLECGDIPTRSQASLEQTLLSREEEADLIEQAGV